MRIRTILAAAAAPAALAAVLLGTAGQASAAVVSPQASISAQASQTYTGKVSQTGVPDTTNGPDSVNTPDYGFGPVWSNDNITRNIQVTPNGPGHWTVTFVENGQYNAFADPNTKGPWTNTGQMHGTVSYDVASLDAPSMSALGAANGPGAVDANGVPVISQPGQQVALPVTVHGHGFILNLLFPNNTGISGGPYSYHYTQVEDVPGVYKQVG